MKPKQFHWCKLPRFMTRIISLFKFVLIYAGEYLCVWLKEKARAKYQLLLRHFSLHPLLIHYLTSGVWGLMMAFGTPIKSRNDFFEDSNFFRPKITFQGYIPSNMWVSKTREGWLQNESQPKSSCVSILHMPSIEKKGLGNLCFSVFYIHLSFL